MNRFLCLVFKHDEVIQQLGATTESERDSWIQALHMASFEYMQSQLSSLKVKLNEIKNLNQNDLPDVSSKRQRSFTAGASKQCFFNYYFITYFFH